MSGYPGLVSCILVFFDSGGPWGHRDPVSAGVALVRGAANAPGRAQDGHKTPSFFHRFFDAFLDQFLVDFLSQLASPNPPNFSKNRCQEPFYLGLQISIDFLSILAANLDPPNLIWS